MDEEYLQKIKRYTIEELQGVSKSIDKDTYPERYEMVQNELKSRLNVNDEDNNTGINVFASLEEPIVNINEPASLGERFWAYLIDALILTAILSTGIIWYLGFGKFMKLAIERDPVYLLVDFITAECLYLLLNGRLLYRYGQTIGKNLLRIKIVDADNNIPKFYKSYVLRYLLVKIPSMVPVIGGFFALVDALFVFNKDRRCIHDHIAGTKVIKAI